MALSRHERTRRKVDLNPLEMIERVVSDNDWPFDRTSDREIAVDRRVCEQTVYFQSPFNPRKLIKSWVAPIPRVPLSAASRAR